MKLVSCLSPRLVRNPYTHDIISAGCGKCDMCLNQRSMDLQERCKSENSFHKFCVFFTLTYNNEHLPLFERVGDYFIDSESGEIVCQVNSVGISLSQYHGSLPHVSKFDIELFLKRMRKHIDKYYNAEKVRYIISAEYGSNTFRPHYHGLLWFESSALLLEINKVIRESWQNGFINSSLAGESSIGYVTKYVNSISHYPSVFQFPQTKCFASYSRCPALGVNKADKKTLYESLFESVDRRITSVRDAIKSVPFLHSFEAYFLPKCRGFNTSSLSQRIAYYKCYESPFFDVFKDGMNYEQHSLDRSISKRVFRFAKWLGVSVDCYIKRIIEYYERKSIDKLKCFYDYESTFSLSYPLERYKLIQLYPNLCKCLTMSLDYKFKKPLLPTTIRYAMRSFGLTTSNLPFLQPFEDSFEGLQYKSVIKKIVMDSDKTKIFNDLYGLITDSKIQYYECSSFK